MACVTLTTDFGTRDWFVGTMKGVILGVNPRATVVDITHEIPAGDIWAGAFALAAACRYFPKHTVHVAVVDPGVGSARNAIAVRTRDYFFVGPDNGVLTLALAREQVLSIRRLENARYFLHPVSQTFHGRDVFAPVAAHLSRGITIARLGRSLPKFVTLRWPAPQRIGKRWRGEIVHIDRFGNGITNLEVPGGDSITFEVRGRKRFRCPLVNHYQAVPNGRPLAVIGSSGFVEIAVNGGSAAKQLGLKLGTQITAVAADVRRRTP